MPEATRTTRPRARAAAKAALAPKPVPAEAPAAEAKPDVERYTFELAHEDDTKRYAKFVVPDGNGCVGSIYAPLGTARVKVLIEGPAS